MRLDRPNLTSRTFGTCATLAAIVLATGSALAQSGAPAANPPATNPPAATPATPAAPAAPATGKPDDKKPASNPVPVSVRDTSATKSKAPVKPGAAAPNATLSNRRAEPAPPSVNLTEEELVELQKKAADDAQTKPNPALERPGAIDANARPNLDQAVVQDGPSAVEFDPPIAELGEMIAGVSKSVTIKIKNITDQPIRITKAIPGCGCTTPVWPKDPIAPGASGDVEITMRPGDKAGIHLNKKVTFNIENHPPAVLTVRGDVVAFVTMSPDLIEQPADLVGAKPTQLTLESTDGTSFKVTEMSPPIVKNMPAESATKHVLDIDWGMWEETGRQMRVVVKTDHPKAPQLTTLVRRAVAANAPNAPTAPTPRPMAGPGTTELITAVRNSDFSKMKALIDGGANVNEQDRAGARTALHWAAKGGSQEALSALMAAKADPNLKDRQGRTPLWGAVETTPAVVKFLIDNGADVNARDTVNATPLLWAAGFGRPETVSLLIANKADVKAVDDNGWTALIWAAGIGQPETVDILIKAGADLNAADRQTGDTPLLRAARTGKPESLKVLLAAGADINARNNLKQTALHCAAQSGSAEKVALLLAAKADPAAVDSRNFTALDHAMNRTTGDKSKLIEILKPVSPESKPAAAPAEKKAE